MRLSVLRKIQFATGKMGNVNQIMTLLKKWHFSLTVQQTTSLDKLHSEKLLFLMKKLTQIWIGQAVLGLRDKKKGPPPFPGMGWMMSRRNLSDFLRLLRLHFVLRLLRY